MNLRLDKRKIARSFSRASTSYEDVAIVQRAVLTEHLARLKVVQMKPETLLDLGSGTGTGAQALADQYKRSRVFALDIAPGMLPNTAENYRNSETEPA